MTRIMKKYSTQYMQMARSYNYMYSHSNAVGRGLIPGTTCAITSCREIQHHYINKTLVQGRYYVIRNLIDFTHTTCVLRLTLVPLYTVYTYKHVQWLCIVWVWHVTVFNICLEKCPTKTSLKLTSEGIIHSFPSQLTPLIFTNTPAMFKYYWQ